MVFRSNSSTTFAGYEICFNSGANGGGIYMSSGSLNIMKSKFINNDAVQYGGGIYIANSEDVTFNNIDMINNQADLGGDEIYFDDGTFTAYDLNIINFMNDESIDGSSSSSAVCKSACLAGEYGICNVSDSGATSCYVNCECYNCTIGTSSSILNSVLKSDCEECDSGKYSKTSKATSCLSCPLGQYATNNESDVGGGKTIQVIEGATTCNDCPSGRYAESTGKPLL